MLRCPQRRWVPDMAYMNNGRPSASNDLVAKIASGLVAAKAAKNQAQKAGKVGKISKGDAARAARLSSAVVDAVKAVTADADYEYTSLLGKAEIAQAAGDRPLAAGYRAKAAAIKAGQ